DPLAWARRRRDSIRRAEVVRTDLRHGHLTEEHTFKPKTMAPIEGYQVPWAASTQSPREKRKESCAPCTITRGDSCPVLVRPPSAADSLAAKALTLLYEAEDRSPECVEDKDFTPTEGRMPWHPEDVPELEERLPTIPETTSSRPVSLSRPRSRSKKVPNSNSARRQTLVLRWPDEEGLPRPTKPSPSPVSTRFSWQEMAPDAEENEQA
ncbi:unnamed protein product, partial [Durusdinium trenchii]